MHVLANKFRYINEKNISAPVLSSSAVSNSHQLFGVNVDPFFFVKALILFY